jgi:hypothetical protein
VSCALAHLHGLSLIELEHNLMFEARLVYRFTKPDGLVLADSVFACGMR